MAPDSLVAWLERLQAARLIELSPRVLSECTRVLVLRETWRREDLADSLASLLAHDESAWRSIRAHFLEHAGVVSAAAEQPRVGVLRGGVASGQTPRVVRTRTVGPSRLSGLRWAAVLLVVVVSGFAFGPTLIEQLGARVLPEELQEDPDLAAIRRESKGNQDKAGELAKEVPVEPPPPPTSEFGLEVAAPASNTPIEAQEAGAVDLKVQFGPPWLRWLLLGLPALLALLAARWWQAIGQYSADVRAAADRAAEARRQAHAEGTAFGVPYHIEQVPPFDFSRADDAATLLGRLTHGVVGEELDVPTTIDRTIAAGGRIAPAFARGGRREVMVVLVDTETGGHPFLDGVEQILARWRRTGLVIERYDYGRVPTRLRKWPDGRPIDLDRLARRSEGRPLLVFSRMAGARDYAGDVSWLRTLAAWPVRAWIDLDPRTPVERPDTTLLRHIAASGLRRFPWTGEDLVLCARHLAAHGEGIRERPEIPVPAADPEALWKWAACAALVPDPSWPQLDAVRRALPELRSALPESRCVQRLIEWARQEGLGEEGRDHLLGEGDRLAFDPDKRTALIARLRRWDERQFARREDRLEFRARALLLHQLEAADTHGDVLGEQLRRLKQAFHRAAMHPDEAERLLQEFSDSAGARELQSLVVEELRLQGQGCTLAGPWVAGTRDALSAWSFGAARARLVDLLRLRTWSWQGVVRALPWAGLGVLSSALWCRVEHGLADPGSRVRPVATLVVHTPQTFEVVKHGVSASGCTQPGLIALADSAPMCFVALTGGTFRMGSPASEDGRSDDENQHDARVEPFAIATHEVTVTQWRAVMNRDPVRCDATCPGDHPAMVGDWNTACEFMNELTILENRVRRAREDPELTPCYLKRGDSWVWEDSACTGFRLPTETEWEYSARAGTVTAFFWGEDPRDACRYANGLDLTARTARLLMVSSTNDCADGYSETSPVGTYDPNGWGLYDMSGNVSEWVWDRYASAYPAAAANVGFAGSPGTGGDSISRGGSYLSSPEIIRSADRSAVYRKNPQESDFSAFGLRCARSSDATTVAPGSSHELPEYRVKGTAHESRRKPVCGDNRCDSSEGEDCRLCADCACSETERCLEGGGGRYSCVPDAVTHHLDALCGDGLCEVTTEDCQTCEVDCRCPQDEMCIPRIRELRAVCVPRLGPHL